MPVTSPTPPIPPPNKRLRLLLAGAILAMAVAATVVMVPARSAAPTVPGTVAVSPARASTPSALTPGPVAPMVEVATAAAATAAAAAAVALPADPAGAAPKATLASTAVSDKANANVASVVEALRTGQHPERLTPFIAPAPFDAAAFAADPQAYLDVVEPGRVWLTAAAGLDVTPLSTPQTDHIRIPYCGSTTLTVQAVPLAPVTYTVLDGGMLPNGLGSMTVRADAQGVASTVYTATPGTVDDVQVVVGSPLASGTVTMVVHVLVENAGAGEPVAVVPAPTGGQDSGR